MLGVLIDELLGTGIELFFNEPLSVYVPPGSELVVPVEHPVVNTGNGLINVGFNGVLDPPKRELPVQVPCIQKHASLVTLNSALRTQNNFDNFIAFPEKGKKA